MKLQLLPFVPHCDNEHIHSFPEGAGGLQPHHAALPDGCFALLDLVMRFAGAPLLLLFPMLFPLICLGA